MCLSFGQTHYVLLLFTHYSCSAILTIYFSHQVSKLIYAIYCRESKNPLEVFLQEMLENAEQACSNII